MSMLRAASDAPPRFLTLPGWHGSGANHWQTRWEALRGMRRVEQSDWEWPLRGDWLARLDEVVSSPEGDGAPAVLVAHSLGCHLVAAWAAHTRQPQRVQAALLVAPPDLDALAAPQISTWKPMLRKPLPFPSTVVLSDDDPYARPDRARRLAADWGSDVVDAGAHGHLNTASGLRDWPQGRDHLDALLRRTAARTTSP